MTRRCLLAHLDAHMERPEERQFNFDPVQRVIGDRGSYVAAWHVRTYLLAGCPGRVTHSDPSVPGRISCARPWYGSDVPIRRSRSRKRGATTLVIDTLRQVIDAWCRCFGHDGRIAREVARAVAGFDPNTEEGEELLALLSCAGTGRV